MSRPAPQRRGLDRDELTAPAPAPDDGAGRVRLRFLPDGADVRVPSGTPVFDAASWNGIAIDSTCGGHGTCKKCKVRIVSGDVPVGPLDPRAFSGQELAEGWRLACRAGGARRSGRRGAAAADAAEGRARRGRAPRDPAPVGAEAPPGAGGADDGGSAFGPAARARRDRRPRADNIDRSTARARRGAAQLQLGCHCRRLRRGAGRRRARRHHRASLRDRVRPRDHHGGGDAAGPRQRPARRGSLDPEPSAAVRRRRDHADLGDDDGRAGAARASSARARDDGRAHPRGVRRGRGGPARGLRDHGLRQHDDDAPGARHRPRAAVDGAVHGLHAQHAADQRARVRDRDPPARAGVRVPVARRLRGRRHRRGDARDRAHPRPAAAAVHRRRDQQRDRAWVQRAGAGDGGARRPCVRGRADQVRDARGRRRDREPEDRRRLDRAGGDRRHRAGGHLRLGARRRGRRARALRAAGPFRAVHPRRGSGELASRPRRPADRDRQGARVRAALARRG